MTKARQLITENMKLVDVVLELVDARIPKSSRNPLLEEWGENKPRLLMMTKADLAEPAMTRRWLKRYADGGAAAVAVSFLSKDTKNEKKKILEGIRAQTRSILEKRRSRGVVNTSMRAMVVGVPNVGKSTWINFFAGREKTETADKPGVTRGKQWIRLEKDLELLDMPGILWPKIEDPETGLKLAATGAVGEGGYDAAELARWLLDWLRMNRPGRLEARYHVDEALDAQALLELISRKRGFLRKGGLTEPEKGAVMILDEFRGGRLGLITLDETEDGLE
jgi:ribosome biogenesis GTPase A